jgi:hypothetical protein
MPRQYNYNCTSCGKDAGTKENLTAEVTVFKNIGYGSRTLRSRVTAWLCEDCLHKHPAWNTGDRTFIDQVARDKNGS